MQATLRFTFRHRHLFRFLVFHAFQRVHFCVIHRGSITHWRWIEVLYLVTTVVVGFQPQREVNHVFIFSTRVSGDEVRDQILFFARFSAVFFKQLFKAIIRPHTRFHHHAQRAFFRMLRSNLQIAANVVGHQLTHVLRRFNRQVVTYTRSDHHFLNALHITRCTIQINSVFVVGIELMTDTREDTAWATTVSFRFRV
ncbi:Uncharacterised protein [Vibrio cholerae]|uniref:Uncharacterized protein n=1 Tax=Vibrio cholerae TaxID=666 RepID=A0A655XD92_VIBCL|nr:Uncharacterised protein [Vibrio cholerae]